MNAVRVVSDRDIDLIRASSRHYAIRDGIAIGVILAVVVCGAIGIGLDAYRARLYDGRVKAAVAEVSRDFRECKEIVERIDDYEQVVAVKRQIDMVREGR